MATELLPRLYVGALLLCAAGTAALTVWGWRRPRARAARAFTFFAAVVAGYLLTLALGLLSPSPAAAALWARVEWFFIPLVPLGLLIFSLTFTGHQAWLTRGRLAGLLVFPLLTQFVVWSPAAPSLILTLDPAGFEHAGPFTLATRWPGGPWYWAQVVVASLLLLVAVQLLSAIVGRASGAHRRQALIILGSVAVLALTSVVEALAVVPLAWLDLPPLALTGTVAALGWALNQALPLGLIPLTIAQAIEIAPDPAVIVDGAQRVLFLNPAAEADFHLTAAACLGRPAAAVLPIWPAVQPLLEAAEARQAEIAGQAAGRRRWWEARCSVYQTDRGAVNGHLVFLRDITARKQTEQRLELQHSLARLLAEARPESAPAEIIPAVLRLVCLHLGWEVGEYWDSDADQASLRYAAGWHHPDLDGAAFEAAARLLLLWRGEGLAGQVWASRQPAWSEDVLHEPGFLRGDAAVQAGLTSGLAFPIISGEVSPGVLIFFSRERRPPEADLLAALAAAGAQLGQYMERWQARLALHDRARYLNLLNAITTTALEQTDLPAMLQALADRLGELLEADGCYLLLWDAALQRAVPMAAYGPMRANYAQAAAPEPGEPTVTAAVLEAGHPIVIDDVFNSPFLSPRIAALFPTRSMLGLPLIADGQKLGAALISFETPHSFSQDEVARGEQAARQVALAVAKARLLEAEREQRQVAEALRAIGAALSAQLDAEALLGRLLELIAPVVPYDAGTVLGLSAERVHVLQARGYERFGPAVAQNIRAMDLALTEIPNLARMAGTGQPVIVPDTDADAHWVHIDPASKLRSWVGVPVLINGRAAAAVSLSKSEAHFYQAQHVERLVVFANQVAIALTNARLYQEAVRAAARREVLQAASREISAAAADREQLFAAIHRAVAQLMPAEAFNIVLVDEVANELAEVYLVDRGERYAGERYPRGAYFAGYVITRGHSVLINDFLDFPESEYKFTVYGGPEDTRSGLAVLMRLGPKIKGVLFTQSYAAGGYTADDQQLLELLAAQAAIALENADLLGRVQLLAVTDGLTGLHNRRHFFTLAEKELERARRHQRSLAVVMFDIDHFKLINDSFGHTAGDQVLRQIAQLAQACFRQVDIIARYGGEEFVVLLPETTITNARQAAERLRQAVAGATFPPALGGQTVTISLGVSALTPSLRGGSEQLDFLTEQADQAMYEAKRSGRNQVVLYLAPSEEGVEP